MNKRFFSVIAFFAASFFVSSHALALGVDVKAIYSQKKATDKDWPDAIRTQTATGIGVDVDIPVLPVDITGKLLYTSAEGKDNDTSPATKYSFSGQEIHLGIIKGFAPLIEVVRPYVGIGVTNISNELTVKQGSAENKTSEDATGYWFGGGVQINLLGWQIAADLRRSYVEGDDGADYGGDYSSFSVGYSFGF